MKAPQILIQGSVRLMAGPEKIAFPRKIVVIPTIPQILIQGSMRLTTGPEKIAFPRKIVIIPTISDVFHVKSQNFLPNCQSPMNLITRLSPPPLFFQQ